jgi:hypothetical protein
MIQCSHHTLAEHPNHARTQEPHTNTCLTLRKTNQNEASYLHEPIRVFLLQSPFHQYGLDLTTHNMIRLAAANSNQKD